MMNEESKTLESQLKIIHDNKHLVPDIYLNDIPASTQANQGQKISANAIKIQTFYKLTQPMMTTLGDSLKLQDFISLGNNDVPYPIASVVAFSNEPEGSQEKFFQINLKLIQWIESGGIRCIPIKSKSSYDQVQKILNLSHCIIIPDNCDKRYFSNKILEQSYEITETIVKLGEQLNLPILLLGNSAVNGLQVVTGKKIKWRFNNEQKYYSQFFISYQSLLFRDLQLNTRLALENRRKIQIPKIQVNINDLNDLVDQSQIMGFIYDKNKELKCSYAQMLSKKIFFILNDPSSFDNPDSIGLWHKLIVNFVDFSKKTKKSVKEKVVEKILVGINKIYYTQDQYKIGYYKIK